MSLRLGEFTDPIGEGQRLGEVAEAKNSLQPLDAIAFHDFPIRDLRVIRHHLRVADGRFARTAGDALLPNQFIHSMSNPPIGCIMSANSLRRQH